MVTNEFDLQVFLPYLLNQAAEASSLEFQGYYKSRYAMLRTEWRVMFHLGHYGAMTAKEICDRAKIHKTKISRGVKALENKRFLNRSSVQKDRRQEILTLTGAGFEAYQDLSGAAQRFDSKLAENLGAEEVEQLRQSLLKIAKL